LLVVVSVSAEPRRYRLRGWAFDVQQVATKEIPMKQSTRDQVQGKVHETKGKIKEQIGKIKNDPNMMGEGQDEKLGGKIQKKIGQIEKVFEK
jgi:uncharacterized protein YjbJ (UPF0337 family)